MVLIHSLHTSVLGQLMGGFFAHIFGLYSVGSGCDNCNEWFHGHCINVTEKMAKAIREWYCMRCRGNLTSSHSFWILGFKIFHDLIRKSYSILPGKNSSLEIKYRTKKSKERDSEPDRAEKYYSNSNPSTPEYRSERRRGSKVRYQPTTLMC
jgi:COMPASS component SPP1